jgi:uncharacterized protein (DUF849 family)
MRDQLPAGAKWAAFGISRAEFPIVGAAYLLGGHVRVGMEDNIYMEKGVLAKSNAELVARARLIVKELGGQIASSKEGREILGLK